MKPLAFMLILMSYLQGCTVEDGRTFLVAGVVPPGAGCTFGASGENTQAVGFFDPAYVEPYTIGLAGYNFLDGNKHDEILTTDTGNSVRPPSNILVAQSLDVCYFVLTGDADYAAYLSSSTVQNVGSKITDKNCVSAKLADTPNALPAFYESVPATGRIDTLEDKGTLVIGQVIRGEIFSPTTLHVLFGDAFNPEAIRNLPDLNTDTSGNTLRWNYFPPSSNRTTREAFWGEWPAARSTLNGTVETIVDIRVRAVKQDGTTILSNWIQYPISLQVKGADAKLCDSQKITWTNCPVSGCKAGDDAPDPFVHCECTEVACACASEVVGTCTYEDWRWAGSMPELNCLGWQRPKEGDCSPDPCPNP